MSGWKNCKTRGRYAEVLAVCVPLVLSTAAGTVMEFTDRIFLANYSLDAISAAVPAGIGALLFIVFFSGVSGYVGVFIAQYTGAGAPAKVGAALWQALYLAAAAGILLSISSHAFMPSLGFSIGVSTLVGQALGRERPQEAATAVWSAAHLLITYVLVLDCLYLLAPTQILSLFVPGDGQSLEYLAVMRMGHLLLRLVAAYVLVDALYLIFVGALKGAGDTRFIMLSVASLSVAVMVLPVYIGIEFFHRGVYFAWGCAALFIVSLFAVSAWRFGQGRWKSTSVIVR